MAETTQGFRAFPGFWRYKKSLITFLIFVAYAAAVFWSNYDSLQQLRNDALIRFQLESEKQAAAISYYFTERQNDIFELAESEPVVSFFKNRDLGMSYEYGLGVNVEFIEDRFAELMVRKRVGGQAIYSGMVLIDRQGVEVANVNRRSTVAGYKTLLAPGQRETRPAALQSNRDPVGRGQRFFANLGRGGARDARLRRAADPRYRRDQ